MKNPKLVLFGGGATGYLMFSVDRENDNQAIALARKLAERTGRAVIVRDAEGAVLREIEGEARH